MKKTNRILPAVSALLVCAALCCGCGEVTVPPSAGTTAVQQTAADGYRVLVTDENGQPVSGVSVQFCSDTVCDVNVTGADGIVAFDKPEGTYTVHILSVPDGFSGDDAEYKAPAQYGTVNITLRAAGEEAAEGDVSFATTDLDGNTVRSADIFKGYKVTVVNLWATWCGPCRGELAELGAMAGQFEEKGCQLIGICEDGEGSAADAKALLKENGCDYLNIVLTDEMRQIFATQGYPTTFFLDSKGNMIAEPVLGAYVERYPEVLEQCLSNME